MVLWAHVWRVDWNGLTSSFLIRLLISVTSILFIKLLFLLLLIIKRHVHEVPLHLLRAMSDKVAIVMINKLISKVKEAQIRTGIVTQWAPLLVKRALQLKKSDESYVRDISRSIGMHIQAIIIINLYCFFYCISVLCI